MRPQYFEPLVLLCGVLVFGCGPITRGLPPDAEVAIVSGTTCPSINQVRFCTDSVGDSFRDDGSRGPSINIFLEGDNRTLFVGDVVQFGDERWRVHRFERAPISGRTGEGGNALFVRVDDGDGQGE